MTLHLHSEPFQPGGNIDARAARRAIGRPSLDPWTVFLRETLQNSWDARRNPKGPIAFEVSAWWATAAQRRMLRSEIFAEEAAALGMDDVLSGDDLGLLLVRDRGTRGLTGPTRADLSYKERTDFVDFVRNIGRAEEKGYAGGTYGFGKGVLYDASCCGTVVVYSRTRSQGKPVSRLIAIALGSSHTGRAGRRYTGRHWWGVADEATGAEPVTGHRADTLAARLGMGSFNEHESGTAILVIGPQAYEDETLHEIVERISLATSWYAWPHLVGRHHTIEFSFSYEGEDLATPEPSRHPVLRHFVDAYRRAESLLGGRSEPDDTWPWHVLELRSERPTRRLGALAYRRYRKPEALEIGDLPLGDVSSSVALMRAQRFVVRYMEVTPDPQGLATAGVFIVDAQLENTFAEAEPIAHDDWAPEQLKLDKFERNPVRQALERIRRTLRAQPAFTASDGNGDGHPGLPGLSSLLGRLLAGQAGGADLSAAPADGAGPNTPPSMAGAIGSGAPETDVGANGRALRSTAAPPHLTVNPRPRLLTDDAGQLLVEFDFELGPRQAQILVSALPRVVVDSGGTEAPGEAPVGTEAPCLVGWRNRDDGKIVTTLLLTLGPDDPSSWAARVLQPPDTAVTIVLSARTKTS